MTQSNDAAAFLMGAGGPSAKFPAVGHIVAGPITRIGQPMQQRDMATNALKFWDDGNPMMQLPVNLTTNERDPEIPNDDGTRTLYIKGQMQNAIRDAVRRSGTKMLEIGGTLAVKYASDGTAGKKGFNPPKVYEANYTPPTNAAAAAFMDTGAPAAPAPAQNEWNTTPAPAAPAAPVAPPQAAPAQPAPVDPSQSPEVQELLAKLAASGVQVQPVSA